MYMKSIWIKNKDWNNILKPTENEKKSHSSISFLNTLNNTQYSKPNFYFNSNSTFQKEKKSINNGRLLYMNYNKNQQNQNCNNCNTSFYSHAVNSLKLGTRENKAIESKINVTDDNIRESCRKSGKVPPKYNIRSDAQQLNFNGINIYKANFHGDGKKHCYKNNLISQSNNSRTGELKQSKSSYNGHVCYFSLQHNCSNTKKPFVQQYHNYSCKKPYLLKTKICNQWIRGYCHKNRRNCHYAHGLSELRCVHQSLVPNYLDHIYLNKDKKNRSSLMRTESDSHRFLHILTEKKKKDMLRNSLENSKTHCSEKTQLYSNFNNNQNYFFYNNPYYRKKKENYEGSYLTVNMPSNQLASSSRRHIQKTMNKGNHGVNENLKKNDIYNNKNYISSKINYTKNFESKNKTDAGIFNNNHNYYKPSSNYMNFNYSDSGSKRYINPVICSNDRDHLNQTKKNRENNSSMQTTNTYNYVKKYIECFTNKRIFYLYFRYEKKNVKTYNIGSLSYHQKNACTQFRNKYSLHAYFDELDPYNLVNDGDCAVLLESEKLYSVNNSINSNFDNKPEALLPRSSIRHLFKSYSDTLLNSNHTQLCKTLSL